jgi:hypothetical protein
MPQTFKQIHGHYTHTFIDNLKRLNKTSLEVYIYNKPYLLNRCSVENTTAAIDSLTVQTMRDAKYKMAIYVSESSFNPEEISVQEKDLAVTYVCLHKGSPLSSDKNDSYIKATSESASQVFEKHGLVGVSVNENSLYFEKRVIGSVNTLLE